MSIPHYSSNAQLKKKLYLKFNMKIYDILHIKTGWEPNETHYSKNRIDDSYI